jgi:hypothetical protein
LEASPTIRSGFGRRWRYNRERRVDQITNGPRAISDAKGNGWGRVKRLVHAAPIVVRDIEADGRGMAFELLAKAVGQPREPTGSHSDRKVGALDEAGRDFRRHTGYPNGEPVEMKIEPENEAAK